MKYRPFRYVSAGLTTFLALHILLSVTCPLPAATTPEKPFTFQSNVPIPMRDGTKLAAHLFLPIGDGPFPVILMRTPYGKPGETFGEAVRYTKAGLAMVAQDCRGRGDSEGVWDPFRYDPEDGFDTQEWIGQQSWCNGSIGTMGGSYVGWTQWASAPLGSRFLKAMVPVVPFQNAYHDIAYPGGAFQLSLMLGWGAAVGGITLDPSKRDDYYAYLPLNRWDDQFDKQVPYLRDWVKHPTYDDYWKPRGIDGRFEDITVPILNIGGWYDIFSKATLEMSDQVRRHSKNEKARQNQYVVMGPWGHGVDVTKLGELTFGDHARINIGELQFKWFQHWLRDQKTGVEEWPPINLFVMGKNQWRGEKEWPLARTQFTPWYLHSEGQARTRTGNGSLSPTLPDQEPNDTFVYDPNQAVPTRGGNNLTGPPIGPFDQSELEERADILVYTSSPLEEALEVTGPVRMVLYASTTSPDTDFTAKLVDVHPDGKAYNLCDGIVRARYRNSFTKASYVLPGKIYRYEIDLWVTSNEFQPGHRVRVEVSSSNFPRFDRNPNSGKPFGSDVTMISAAQSISHNPKYPSHIILPIIPKETAAQP